MSVLKIVKSNFDSIRNGDAPVIIDFYADWCGPCKMVAPVIENIAEENAQYRVGKVNVDDEPELAREFGVYSIPTIVALKGGREVGRRVGYCSKEHILGLLD